MSPRKPSRSNSRRFLSPQELGRNRGAGVAWGNDELFSEGQWQAIRVGLEVQGWNRHQIELIHDQLRQGWSLVMAQHNVSMLSGHCPLRAYRQS